MVVTRKSRKFTQDDEDYIPVSKVSSKHRGIEGFKKHKNFEKAVAFPSKKVCNRVDCFICEQKYPKEFVLPMKKWKDISEFILYCLKQIYPSNTTGFKLEDKIFPELEMHWDQIVRSADVCDRKWTKQLNDALSHTDTVESTRILNGQKGWWRIQKDFGFVKDHKESSAAKFKKLQIEAQTWKKIAEERQQEIDYWKNISSEPKLLWDFAIAAANHSCNSTDNNSPCS